MAHSKLAPSASERWIPCPGSIAFSERFPPSKSSSYADEGTAAHALADYCLKNKKNPHEFLGRKMNGHNYSVTKDMADAVAIYVDFIRKLHDSLGPDSKMEFERKLNLSFIHKDMPGGTSDCTLKNKRVLYVADYKHGAGVPVTVDHNSQLMIYGLGADPTFDYDELHLIIIQPRAKHDLGPIREWIISASDMRAFKAFIMAACDATTKPNARLHAGDHCRWCPCKGGCPQQKKQAEDVAKLDFKNLNPVAPEKLSKEQIKLVLDNFDLIDGWLKSVWEYAQDLILKGESIEGYKLVKSFGHRAWKNKDEVEEKLLDYAVDPFEKKLKTPAVIEKELTALKIKKNTRDELLKTLCFKPDNGPTLVLSSKKGEEYVPPQAAFLDLSLLE